LKLYHQTMLVLPVLLAVAAMSAPDEALAGEVRAAVWDDLQLNAMIGNGNWIASLWYNASNGDPEAPDLHINGLLCQPHGQGYYCSFRLFRGGGPRRVLGEEAPDKLDCTATLVSTRDEGGIRLTVKHTPPPPGGGHSRTTMRCKRSTA